ncbi:MAG: NAD(P)H-dependent oxidoreductase [Anaerolineaceae bacterium]|nr:NAD(P)H-dependent oxidoreductase [Anaerolineaceae bacterium]
MKLVMFNGSPRGKNSNTRLLFEQILAGMREVDASIEAEVVYLRDTDRTALHVAAVDRADMIILGFPLYTDGMPGVTKHFIDALYPHNLAGKPLAFLVQSGFPESRHSQPVARYLKKLCERLNGKYAGTIIRGGVEGIQVQPEGMTRKLFKRFYQLGVSLAADGCFDDRLLKELLKPEKMSLAAKAFLKTNASRMYWDMKLKENNAFDKRFDRPYVDE